MFFFYASLEFVLTPLQVSSGSFVPPGLGSANNPVSYTLGVYQFPVNAGIIYTYNNDTSVLNNEPSNADVFVNSGYFSMKAYVDSFIARLVPGVPANYATNPKTQRYPKNKIVYPDELELNIGASRFNIFKWIAPVIITIAMFYPVLSLCATAVREKQYLMRDLLEISGIMPISYWLSYFISGGFIIGQLMAMLVFLILVPSNVICDTKNYYALLSCFIAALIAFSLAFGHVIPRCEYYGLPVFLLNTAMAVAGTYEANNQQISVPLKNFISILVPPIGLSNGIWAIESWQFDHQDKNGNPSQLLSSTYVDPDKNIPSIQQTCGMLILSCIIYMFLAWGYPFTWIIQYPDDIRQMPNTDNDIDYPCDNEEEDKLLFQSPDLVSKKERPLLDCKNMTQIYPDGTKAVSGISFSVCSGEVLSFLGANGAGLVSNIYISLVLKCIHSIHYYYYFFPTPLPSPAFFFV